MVVERIGEKGSDRDRDRDRERERERETERQRDRETERQRDRETAAYRSNHRPTSLRPSLNQPASLTKWNTHAHNKRTHKTHTTN